MFRRLAFILLVAVSTALAQSQSSHRKNVPTPPMGWNSWDCFGTTVTEEQAKAQAEAMAKYLKPYGWTCFTVDIQWYEPDSQGHSYRRGARLEMDEYSRLIPGLKKFPSSSEGRGFKPRADYVHAQGLKFGIHIMRGIPRQAVRDNTSILGADVRAAAIAVKHFSTATSETDLKWLLVPPRPNQCHRGLADSYVAFCENNNMFAVSHGLVWHGQTPRWVFQDGAGSPDKQSETPSLTKRPSG